MTRYMNASFTRWRVDLNDSMQWRPPKRLVLVFMYIITLRCDKLHVVDEILLALWLVYSSEWSQQNAMVMA